MSRLRSPDTLIGLAISALKSELQPALPGEHRYTAAMIVNALEIARREVLADGDADGAVFALLDKAYDDGEGSMAALARDIRAGRFDDEKHPWLEGALRAALASELAILNPKALKPPGSTGLDT